MYVGRQLDIAMPFENVIRPTIAAWRYLDRVVRVVLSKRIDSRDAMAFICYYQTPPNSTSNFSFEFP